MSAIIDQALDKISHYQSIYTENDKQYWIAEQIKDICRESDTNAEHVFNDIDDEKMSIAEVEKKIAAYAGAHGGCTPPKAADDIIRKFFGLAERAETPKSQTPAGIISLEDFI